MEKANADNNYFAKTMEQHKATKNNIVHMKQKKNIDCSDH